MVLVALAAMALVVLVSLASPANAATPIPGTNIQVVAFGSAARTVDFGGYANFTWGVYNIGPQTYVLNVSAVSDDAAFDFQVSPTDFSVPRDTLVEVHLNVTAPRDGMSRTATIVVTFSTMSPVAGSVDQNVTLTARATPASVDILTTFAAVGAIIAIGFTASLIFEKTRIPDLLILIALGLVLGPIALHYFGISFVPPGILDLVTPYFTALALMFILFDGGLNLRFGSAARQLGLVGLFTGFTFVATIFAVAIVAVLVLGYDWLVALLLGTILSGTSGAVVLGIVKMLRVGEGTKMILALESVVTDVAGVVIALALLELLEGGPGASATIVFSAMGRAFAVSMVFGLAVGLGWLVLLHRIEDSPFSYMLTIAVLFVLYAFSETAGGSGAMASFVFGLVLGNHLVLEKVLRIRTRFVIDDRIKQFHSELSFLIRTFFFVFLGLVFTFEFTGRSRATTSLPLLDSLSGTYVLSMIGIGAIFLAIVAVRYLGAVFVARLRPGPPGEKRVLWTLMGRGLSAAVLSSLPFTIPAFTDPSTPSQLYYQTLMEPYQTAFLNTTFFIILLTVIATTIGVAASERSLGSSAKATAVGPTVDPRGLVLLREMELDDLEVIHEPPRRP